MRFVTYAVSNSLPDGGISGCYPFSVYNVRL